MMKEQITKSNKHLNNQNFTCINTHSTLFSFLLP
uniref:Uncharacterized protein n=1 Tax=Schistosoma haematobium TaxID=6185 RepID=A0A094ZY60_SCHHA